MSRVAPLVVLCVNSGSSSLKTALFEVDDAAQSARWPVPRTRWSPATTPPRSKPPLPHSTSRDCRRRTPPATVSYTAGPATPSPSSSTTPCSPSFRELVPFAPLHIPAAISGIEAIGARWDIPQAACFDTAFHHDMPTLAQRLPLPDARGRGPAALWLSRLVVRVHRRRARRAAARPRRHRAPRQRRQHGRRASREVGRHDDGLHAGRRIDHEHPQRRPRSGRPGLPAARAGLRRRPPRAARRPRRGAGWRCRAARRTCRRCSTGETRISAAPRSPSTPSVTRPASTSARSPPCSAASTRSCSPAASARRPPASGPRSAAASSTSEWCSTEARTTPMRT